VKVARACKERRNGCLDGRWGRSPPSHKTGPYRTRKKGAEPPPRSAIGIEVRPLEGFVRLAIVIELVVFIMVVVAVFVGFIPELIKLIRAVHHGVAFSIVSRS